MGTILPHKDEILSLYAQGWSCAAIGRRFGVETAAITAFLNRSGVRAIKHNGKPRLSPEQKGELSRLYASGVNSGELAKRFGLNQCTVREIARKHGVASRGVGDHSRVLTPEEIARAHRLFSSGVSLVDIGRELGCFSRIVSAHLKSAGVIIEPRNPKHRDGASRWMDGTGYWHVKPTQGHPYALPMMNSQGNILEHRLVMSEKLGRPLSRKETVHHIDGDKSNNHPDNLQLRHGNHGKHAVYVCCDCGSRNVKPAPLDEPPKEKAS